MRQAVKNGILPALTAPFGQMKPVRASPGTMGRWVRVPDQVTAHQTSRPKPTENKPKKRNCPSLRRSRSENMRLQAAGSKRGRSPSKISIRPRAGQKMSDRDTPMGQRPTLLLRSARKKSDDGSTTITSDLPAKLAL
jgi:hypothetical protein